MKKLVNANKRKMIESRWMEDDKMGVCSILRVRNNWTCLLLFFFLFVKS